MSIVISESVLDFLNALPVTGDTPARISAFREALQRLLGDVDRITVNVNMNCNLDHPEDYAPKMAVTQHSSGAKESEGTVVVDYESEELQPVERLLQNFQRQGFPLERYHSPHSFNYTLGEHAYLGTIFLWRELSHSPVSSATLDTVGKLEPFLVYALSDLVARHQRTEPIVGVFEEAMRHLAEEAGLSRQEQRVLFLQLLGNSYKEMADMLAVSMDTVKFHLKTIYRKTGTRSQSELFAKYFTPRLDLSSSEER